MTTRIKYCQYLLSSQTNYTITNFSDHVEGLSHDKIRRYLKNAKLSPRLVWEHSRSEIIISKNGKLLFDDSVLDKSYSYNIEEVRYQYSGNAKEVIKGIGVVTCVYVNPEENKFWIIDYRIFNPDKDGLTKIDHVKEMLRNAHYAKNIEFTTVLMDSWYATTSILLQIETIGKYYYCPIKSNRLVDDSSGVKSYCRADALEWSKDDISKGKIIKIHKFPKDHKVKLFRVTVSTNRTDYVITNNMAQDSLVAVQKEYDFRWKIEEFHREVKQVTGIEKCQCRIGRIQRNHIACAILVWNCLKKVANAASTTVYQVKSGLLRNYLIQELRNPIVSFA
jgi:hypothetical protein